MNSSNQKPKSSSSMSSTDIVACNDDIILEILLRLPAKSLPKFRSVCKRWLHLISDPNFKIRHYRQHVRSVSGFILTHIFCYKKAPTYMHLSLDENDNSAQIRRLDLSFDSNVVILQSCNGLLLCSRRLVPNSPSRRYYVFNPTTHSLFMLPEPQPVWGKRTIACFSLAYDPTVSSVYKVVCLDFNDPSCHVQIYSSETGNWRNVGNRDFCSYPISFHHGVFWNGGIHWVNSYDGNVLRFDIENETLQAMPRPSLPKGWNSHSFRNFLESQGHLFFVTFQSPEYIIHEREKDCSKWFVKHRLDINLIVSAFPDLKTRNKQNRSDPLFELANLISVVSLVELEDEGSSLVMFISGKFISYSFKLNSLKTLCDAKFFSPTGNTNIYWYSTYNYMKTLLSS